MLYWAPPLTLIVVGTFVPVTVIGFDTGRLEGATLLSGTKVNLPGTALVPVPESVTVVGEEAALLVMVSVPARLPSAVGVNTTWIVQLLPLSAALQSLVWLKSPLEAKLVMVAPLVPVRMMVCALPGAPTVCGPNDSVPGLAARVTAQDTFEVAVARLLVGSGSMKLEELPKSALAVLLTVVPQMMAGSSVPVIV